MIPAYQKSQQDTSSTAKQSSASEIPQGTFTQPAGLVQRTMDRNRAMQPSDYLYLQRTIGNRATSQFISKQPSRDTPQASQTIQRRAVPELDEIRSNDEYLAHFDEFAKSEYSPELGLWIRARNKYEAMWKQTAEVAQATLQEIVADRPYLLNTVEKIQAQIDQGVLTRQLMTPIKQLMGTNIKQSASTMNDMEAKYDIANRYSMIKQVQVYEHSYDELWHHANDIFSKHIEQASQTGSHSQGQQLNINRQNTTYMRVALTSNRLELSLFERVEGGGSSDLKGTIVDTWLRYGKSAKKYYAELDKQKNTKGLGGFFKSLFNRKRK